MQKNIQWLQEKKATSSKSKFKLACKHQQEKSTIFPLEQLTSTFSPMTSTIFPSIQAQSISSTHT